MQTLKKRTIMQAVINSQFGHCPLVWMFHNQTLDNRINKIHERALCIVYNDISTMNYFREISMLVFILETSRLWQSNCTRLLMASALL